jgi:phosphomannomutase
MAGRWLPIVFRGLRKINIFRLNFEHQGEFQHPPDPLKTRNTKELRNLVRERKADLGVCFNGDAAACTFVDEKGAMVSPDMIATLLAKMFIEREPGANIVLDPRSSRVALEEIDRAGGLSIRRGVGTVFMRKTMSDRRAAFGADLSGRFYFRDNFYCESGILAMVHVLNLLAGADCDLSDLVRPLNRYRSSGELRYRCPEPDKAVKDIADAHRDAEIETFDGVTVHYPDWWFNVRPSRAESLIRVTLEARTRKLVDQRLSELEPLLTYRA